MPTDLLRYPFEVAEILRRKKSLKRELLKRHELIEKRIAILGGSTTAEIREILELFLLDIGIKPAFYESGYNRFFEESVFENKALADFKPDVFYIHTTNVNVTAFPAAHDSAEIVAAKLKAEVARFETIWDKLKATYGCTIIQNNFELPHARSLGNLDCSDIHGKSRFIAELNAEFARHSANGRLLLINDINYLSAWFGLHRWHDRTAWFSYKYALSYDAIPLLAHNVARIIGALYGRSRKCLILDLDDTLWGGVAGDVGIEGIQIGKESAVAEAYMEFQTYVKELKERGVILAICSKNDHEVAMNALSHPSGVLRADDFASIKATWDPKHLRIEEIARELNLGRDSMVFVDDNPAEREIVRTHFPEVLIPELGGDVTRFVEILDQERFFEPLAVSADDLKRTEYYRSNRERQQFEAQAADYGDYLDSLAMVAEIKPFDGAHTERITQLINKTNQFNLTTKRCSLAEVAAMNGNPHLLTLYARLADKFGDNGLVSVVVGTIGSEVLHIDLWLMSCRVMKRELELAVFDEVVVHCVRRGVRSIMGYYYRTPKNSLVAGHYESLGFTKISSNDAGDSQWEYAIPADYQVKNKHIKSA